MKIQQVKIKEFKAIKNLDEEINGNNILLLGDNGVGKSSFIQFIEIALGKTTNIPPNATGEGEVITDKNGNKYTFSVKFKDGKPVVGVVSPDGLKDTRKGTIAGIVGAIEFDIDKFTELSKTTAGRKQQVEIFKSFLGEDIKDELSRYEANVRANYEARTDVNRQIKEKESAIKQNSLYNEVGANKSFEKVDVSNVMSEMTKANESNAKILEVKSRIESRTKDIEKTKLEVEKKNKEIEALLGEVALLNKTIESDFELNLKAESWLTTNKTVDVSEFETKIKSATETNKKYEDAQQLKKDIAILNKMKEESEDLTVKIESEKQAIQDAIRDMESPIKGLSFDEEQLVYNGIPVNPDSLSTSEIMELGIRLKMAENPDLGILFIERGESLGQKRLQEIQSIAEKAGWQIIMEQVERGTEKLHIEIMGA
jgi:chromosome segregation ATPase